MNRTHLVPLLGWCACSPAAPAPPADRAPSDDPTGLSDTETGPPTDTSVGTEVDSGSEPDPVEWRLRTCPPYGPDGWIHGTELLVEDDELVIQFAYNGGCEPHVFGACFGPGFDLSGPEPSLDVHVAHQSNGDPCAQPFSEELRVDLRQVREQYEATFGEASGTLDLSVRWIVPPGSARSQVVPYSW